MANIKTRRALSELFVQGVEVRFGKDPETGKPTGKVGPFKDENDKPIPCPDGWIAMWIRPADPVQRDQAMRAGQAKRAMALVKAKRDENSEEYLTIMAFLADMSDETLIDYVITGDTGMRRSEAERETLALEEWKDMTQYQDAMRMFQEMKPEQLEGNEEWEALLELDEKYTQQIISRELELADAQREALRMLNRDVLEKKALDRRAEMVGTQAFMQEYERQMYYFAVRDIEDRTSLFFENAEDFATQPDEVRELVSEAMLPFISDGSEAKNLPGVASGSDSSELPVKPETSEPSIPEELSA